LKDVTTHPEVCSTEKMFSYTTFLEFGIFFRKKVTIVRACQSFDLWTKSIYHPVFQSGYYLSQELLETFYANSDKLLMIESLIICIP